MSLAFAFVLLIGVSGITRASIGGNYVPSSCVLIGPPSVSAGQTANFVLTVNFLDGGTATYPPAAGALFNVARGSITQKGVYTAPTTGPRDRVTASFTENGVTTSASRIITIK